MMEHVKPQHSFSSVRPVLVKGEDVCWSLNGTRLVGTPEAPKKGNHCEEPFFMWVRCIVLAACLSLKFFGSKWDESKLIDWQDESQALQNNWKRNLTTFFLKLHYSSTNFSYSTKGLGWSLSRLWPLLAKTFLLHCYLLILWSDMTLQLAHCLHTRLLHISWQFGLQKVCHFFVFFILPTERIKKKD